MKNPTWTSRGKTVAQLIEELQTFEDQNLEVRISIDDGETSYPVSLVGKSGGKYAILRNCEDEPSIIVHRTEKQ